MSTSLVKQNRTLCNSPTPLKYSNQVQVISKEKKINPSQNNLYLSSPAIQSILFCSNWFSTGKPCIVCSTKSFTTAYETAPGLVYPATLMSMLPNINSRFQKGVQQCAAEFFQEYCRYLGYRFNECQNNGFIPQHIDLSYLKTFFFNLRSEILCLKCNTVSCNSSMETLLPLHLAQVTTYV